MKRLFLFVSLLIIGCHTNDNSSSFIPQTIHLFQDNMIHFSMIDSIKSNFETVRVSSQDNGREIITHAELPHWDSPVKITASVNLRPIPKDILSVHDSWDRAGHIRLIREDGPDIEIMKFMTAYGGKTEWEIDVSHLAPILKGSCSFVGWIDTWVSPAWRMDFYLEYESNEVDNPDWIKPIFYKLSYELKDPGNEGLVTNVIIPDYLDNVELYYLVSGHCTDGRGADEFEPKDNVFYVDGNEVHRFRPWRTDCKQFRAINPYTRRWSNGDWSSDFDRTNWCPGDKVDPLQIDLNNYLSSGSHELKLAIENVRPVGDDGYLGYWRVSAYLVGWKK